MSDVDISLSRSDEFNISCRSYASSVLSYEENQKFENGNFVPYDFKTLRIAKEFFEEELINLNKGHIDAEYVEAV